MQDLISPSLSPAQQKGKIRKGVNNEEEAICLVKFDGISLNHRLCRDKAASLSL